jgi:hypothetical protein
VYIIYTYIMLIENNIRPDVQVHVSSGHTFLIGPTDTRGIFQKINYYFL